MKKLIKAIFIIAALFLPQQLEAQKIPSAGAPYGAGSLGPCLTNAGGQLNITAGTPNAQTGTTYAFQATDQCKLVTFNNASAVASTLSSATSIGFTSGYAFQAENIGQGPVTITPTTSTINGGTKLVLAYGQSCQVTSNGTNYITSFCAPLVNNTNSGGTESDSPAQTFLGHIWNSGSGDQIMNAFTELRAYSSNTNPEISMLTWYVSGEFGVLPSLTLPTMFLTGNGIWGVAGGAFFNAPANPGNVAIATPNDVTLYNPTAATSSVAQSSYKYRQIGSAWNSGLGFVHAGMYTQININTNNAAPPVSRWGIFIQDGTGFDTTYSEQAAIYSSGGVSIGASDAATKPPANGLLLQGNAILQGTITAASTGSVTPGTAACFSASGVLGTDAANCISSLLAYKQDLTFLYKENVLSEIHKLAKDAIAYRYTDDHLGANKDKAHAKDRQVGFGAEWIERDDPRLAEYSDGKLSGVRYEQLTALEVVAIDKLAQQIFWLKIAIAFSLIFSVINFYWNRSKLNV